MTRRPVENDRPTNINSAIRLNPPPHPTRTHSFTRLTQQPFLVTTVNASFVHTTNIPYFECLVSLFEEYQQK